MARVRLCPHSHERPLATFNRPWNALAFGPARQVNQPAAVAPVWPQREAGALDREQRFRLRRVRVLLPADAEPRSHFTPPAPHDLVRGRSLSALQPLLRAIT